MKKIIFVLGLVVALSACNGSVKEEVPVTDTTACDTIVCDSAVVDSIK